MNGEGVLCAKLVPNICSICVDVMGACVPNAGIICMFGNEDDDDDDDDDFGGLGVMSEVARKAVKRSKKKKKDSDTSSGGSQIYFSRFETFGRNADKDWVMALPDGERVLGCATGNGWGAVITR